MSYAQLSVNAREIVARFALATSQEVEFGRAWYPTAAKTAHRLGCRYGVPTDTATAVISALSPNNQWDRNVVDAEAMCKVFAAGGEDTDLNAVTVSTYGINKELATRLLLNDDTSILTGPKRKEFYNCIIRPELNDVCIDTHAYSVWLGKRVTTKECPNLTGKIRQRIKQDYHDATVFLNEELGESFLTAHIQAITWVTHRRIHGIK